MDIRRSASGKSLTRKQLEFFEKLLEHHRREGVPPTVRELQEECGFRSPRSVLQFLGTLEEAGYIERVHGARNIRILKPPPMDSDAGRARTVQVPLVGKVSAGAPILAEENIKEYVPIESRLARPPHRYFLLHVVGNSMNRAGIKNGDLALVRQQNTAETGDRVVALIDDAATIKEFHRTEDAVVLKPRSSEAKHRPIILTTDFLVQGVVVAAIPGWDHK
jgi:repressor LexA